MLSSCSAPELTNDESPTKYRIAVWIAYYELQKFTQGNNEEIFTDLVDEEFKRLKKYGFNTITVQVRPCADAFYKSNYFPVSEYFNGIQGGEMPYDPLEIMCSLADKYGFQIEAWINPYRVSQGDDYDKLDKNSFAVINKNMTKAVDNKIYFNPAYDEVKQLIVDGVREIVENYSIDAIHFDDYFYPTTSADFDKKEYKKYKGDLSLADWRRDNVNDMIQKVSNVIKSINPNVKFGISPAADVERDREELYADVELWIKNNYIDYICPQIYYGFKNNSMPFIQTVKKWVSLCRDSGVDLFIGLALYKSNTKDEYASSYDKNAINEFKNNNNIIARQIIYISKINEIKGYYIFSHSNLYDKKSKDEVSNMLNAMQSNNQAQNQP